MLMRTDPFRELDRLTQQVFGSASGTWSRPAVMPMDAYRSGDEFVVAFDLPGVSPDAIELDVERNVLTVKAERRPLVTGDEVHMQVSERPLAVRGGYERGIRDALEAIIAASWAEPPARLPHHRPPPAPGDRPPPHRAGGRPPHTRPGAKPPRPDRTWARERSPPGRAAARAA